MLPVLDKEDVYPMCPHGERQLTSIWRRALESVFGKRYVYFCPDCKKVLGISQRKGFWMG